MKFLIALISLCSSMSLAQDLDFSGYKRSLVNGNTKNALNTICKNSKGESFRIGEKGYDACINENKPAAPTDTGKAAKTVVK